MRILITGGSGYLGRGIMKFWPGNSYVVYSRDETKQDVAKQKYSGVKWVLGDVRDLDRLQYAMRDVELVIHAAAIKYIPEAEANVDECVKVNIDGSRNVITAAIRSGVDRVVGISTDKAVQPVNTYGFTKALMERMFVEANGYSKTEFALTRYGNVVGSTGSVVTVFERQLRLDGKVKVTDPDMTRFWQSVEFSVQLIREAVSAPKGCIVIPKAQAMRIGDLAELVARGHPVEIVGPRPGEKQHETLLGPHEASKALDKGWYYDLYPTTSDFAGNAQPFSSDDSPLIARDDMARMIQEAACI